MQPREDVSSIGPLLNPLEGETLTNANVFFDSPKVGMSNNSKVASINGQITNTEDTLLPDCDLLAALNRRRSVLARTLTAPGPDDAVLRSLLQAALRVPDHGKLTPWRLLSICGDDRDQFGSFVAKRKRVLEPEAAPALIEKELSRFRHAPLVLVVIASPRDTCRVPEQEQMLSAGCVCFALLQSAQAHGFGAQWLTGWLAYDTEVMHLLGLADHEKIVGFIHIGTPTSESTERARPNPVDVLIKWSI